MDRFQEVTAKERAALMGYEFNEEEQEFEECWRTFNQRVLFKDAVSVIDTREIDLMWTFWKAGKAYGQEHK